MKIKYTIQKVRVNRCSERLNNNIIKRKDKGTLQAEKNIFDGHNESIKKTR